ncbi:uncharacterized protein LOC107412838 isoform X1 [Ziziphus jujuba]|uniref:Uncharacterized protein LOC107412838 isoform X1 n=1 Tax=Ziziphus jujuba TaxID=326968 RepID=A0A6P3ZRJ9_ZIZJJ|nr:uncharacterized protein LOC107412838 isoform X1 [Ziziphus jujuba]
MAISYKYWDDCVDPQDMEALWNTPEVSAEWLDAGETRKKKVHLSRDPDGQPYLTQTEMKAVVDIVLRRHFGSEIDPAMICALAELESDRQPLATRYNKKIKETTVGIMQLLPKTAEWLVRDLHYQSYQVEENPDILFRPFVNVYFGAAYLKWLSNFEEKERSEEFVVRSYKGGTKKAIHKSTLPYWQRYLMVKDSLPFRKLLLNEASASGAAAAPPVTSASPVTSPDLAPNSQKAGVVYTYWDSRASPEHMEDMWNHPEVLKEWSKCGEKRGKVRFSHDEKKRPYLSRVELKAVAEIILFRHFSTYKVQPTILCALAEVVSMRFVNGVGPRAGIMGLDYSTVLWLYTELGFRAFKVDSVDDLTKPFLSMYFGAAYFLWLSQYEGRERAPQFIVQAYIVGPKNVNFQEKGPMWLKFEEALSNYGETKKDQGSCFIM